MNILATDKRAQILNCLAEGCSMRSTTRLTGAAKKTVERMLVSAGMACAVPAVQREITNRQPNDPVRVALEFLAQRAVGRKNAIPLPKIVAYLKGQGITITETQFQQTVLAESRGADYFIGSGHRGFYLITTIGDAEEMRDFYEARIRTEQQNLDNLRRQAKNVGWNI